MSSIHEDTEPQQKAKTPLPPKEHLAWARQSKDGKEHVTFPKFVTHFKFYNRTDAHSAFCCLLDSSKIKQQRLKKIQLKYESFKRNEDDLYWSGRLRDKSTTIVVNNASIQVQEAGLKQVDSNIQRHFNRHGQQTPRTTTEVREDYMDSMSNVSQAEESGAEDDGITVGESEEEDDNFKSMTSMNASSSSSSSKE
ncbi:hypothetical protein BGX21_006672, partial [Mortierella sp. AD011]